MAKRKSAKKQRKVYVLDTSVIIYDHEAIKNFEENDVAIPITVLEELDNFKKGNDTKNFAAREFIRFLDTQSKDYMLQDWIPIEGRKKGRFRVLLDMQSQVDARRVFDENKADHKILNAALALKENEKDAKVVLVTKDINLRLKAKSLDLPSEDYETGKIRDLSKLYMGKSMVEGVSTAVINEIFEKGLIPAKKLKLKPAPLDNHYFILRNGSGKSVLAYYHAEKQLIERVEKKAVYGIMPRNAEQAFAIHAILNPDVKLLSIQGVAGTGKTLIALAGALEQRRDFKQVFLARPIVPLSNKDIGFLPGDVKSKLNPYMEPLWDNLKFIKNQYDDRDKENKQLDQMVEQEKIVITPLAYIRGRSLSNVIMIIDEAQNLTPHEVKTIITRMGENSKVIFTGDIHQIDTPYLDAQSNGLSHLIDRMKGHPIVAHVTLEKGERSALANLANELL